LLRKHKKSENMNTQHLTAVITGATSGIGKSFAFELAEKGYNLVLTSRRKEELLKTAQYISETFHVMVETYFGDLSETKYRSEITDRIKTKSSVDILINNAGFGIDHAFYKTRIEDARSMLMTHDLAAIEFIHAVLPGMISRRSGIIINVSSLGLFFPGFTRSLYLATKSFLHYFTMALSLEVYPYGVRLQSLCPGMTYSDFHKRARENSQNDKIKTLNFMTPDQVVETSLKSLRKGNLVCIPGKLNKLLVIIAKLLPVKVLRLLSKFRIEKPGKEIADFGIRNVAAI
jgi:uncharacterized protein